jgi:membrane-bound metal-dependent hydrolase YbcI (DUF457 family)
MPSPVGHALGGLIFGWCAASPAKVAPARPGTGGEGAAQRLAAALRAVATHPWTLGFAVLGAAADADFALGIHSRQTHSVGATVVVGLAAAAWGGRLDLRRGLACGLAYGSHVLFDWLGSDTAPPIGIMALWPFASDFYQSEFHVFTAIWREPWRPGFLAHNLGAVLREVLLLAPVAGLTWWGRRSLDAATSRPGFSSAAHRR